MKNVKDILNLTIENYLALCAILIIIGILRYLANRLKVQVHIWIRNLNSYKVHYFRNFICKHILYFLLTAIIILQYKFKIIYKIDKTQSLVLIVSILALYGIFLSFIQFLFGFGAQNKNDSYWGESKTRFLLTRSIEYKFLNSFIFRLMIIYVGIYTLVSEAIIITWKHFRDVEILFDDIYLVSITIIVVEYIMLFIKSMEIKRKLISIQEKLDRGIKYNIEYEIKHEFKNLLYESFNGKYDYFTELLIDRLNKAEDDEKNEMLKKILFDVYLSWNYNQKRYDCRWYSVILDKVKFFRSKDDYRVYRIKNECKNLWEKKLFNHTNLSCKDLLNIYKYQEEIIFNELKLRNSDMNDDFMNDCVSFFDESRGYYKKTNVFYFPEQIWNSISSYEDVEALVNYVEEMPLIKYLDNQNIELFKCENYSSFGEALINDYKSFIRRLLNIIQGKRLYKSKNFTFIYIFDLNEYDGPYRYEESLVINDYEMRNFIRKKIILYYMRDLSNTQENKEYILKLCDALEDKFIYSWIFYWILYPAHHTMKWDQEIRFFKKITDSKGGTEDTYSNKLIDFVASEIDECHIGHRIRPDLIKWIFNNFDKSLSELLIQDCIDRPYIDYLKFLKLRFILRCWNYRDVDKYDYRMLDISKINEKFADWRVTIINSIISEPELINIDYFYNHLLYIIIDCLKNDIPEGLYQSDKCETFLIGFHMIPISSIYKSMLTEKKNIWIYNGIFDYLVLRLHEREFLELLSDNSFKKFFLNGVERSLSYHNLSLKDYTDLLHEKATQYKYFIPLYKKDRILKILEELLENNYNLIT